MKTELQADNNTFEYVEQVFEFRITSGINPVRIDTYLTNSIQNASRNKVQKALDGGFVEINGTPAKKNRKVRPGDHIICKILKPPRIELIPQDIPIDIVYEDDDVLVINKPAGMCTHPGFGNPDKTVVNAVLYYLGHREKVAVDLEDEDEDDTNPGEIYASDLVKPGIVHRLDKNTSGLLTIAKNTESMTFLQNQFADRSISRLYQAIVWGDVRNDSGIIESDIGRSTRNRKLYAVVKRGGKFAKTEYRVLHRYGLFTYVELKLHTGRTHQIRVHMASINHPVLGDPDYGGNKLVYGGENSIKRQVGEKSLEIASRQMLHAKELTFIHPKSDEKLRLISSLPVDFQELISVFDEKLIFS